MRTKQESGFILVAVVALVMIAALVALAQVAMQRAQRTLTHQTGGSAALNNLDAALANFVANNRRLPCPANGLLKITAAGAGIEQRAAGGTCIPVTQIDGVVPWVTLGLPASAALDAWGNQITYRVDPQLVNNSLLMNMSSCANDAQVGSPVGSTAATTPSGACKSAVTIPVQMPPCLNSTGCTSPADFFANKGLDVWNGVAPYDPLNHLAVRGTPTGAAYVLISHGQDGRGALSSQGTLLPAPAAYADEKPNYNGTPLVVPQNAASAFVAAAFNNTGLPAVYFDDQIRYPTILAVLIKANLNPRN